MAKSTDEFIKENVPRGTSSPKTRGVSSLKGYGEGDEAEYARKSAREIFRALVGMDPYDKTNPTEAYRIASTATPLTLIGGGIKGIKGVGKGLSRAEQEANLARFLEPSKVKERLYHGSHKPAIVEFQTGRMLKEKQYPGNTIESWAVDNRDAVFLTPDPKLADSFAGSDFHIGMGYTPATYPVRVQVKNPWDYDNPEHIENVINAYKEKYPLKRTKDGVSSEESMRHHRFETAMRELPLREKANWSGIEKADVQEIIRDLGHDGFFVKEGGVKNLGVYDPRRIKSDLGNEGTYDITDPDINKAKGGEISTKDFIAKFADGSPNPDEVPSVIDEREEIRSESQRMLNRLASQSKLPPGLQRTIQGARARQGESLIPAAVPARDVMAGMFGAQAMNPGSEAYRTGQALANSPPVEVLKAPAKIASAAGDAATALAAMGPAVGAVIKPKGGNWLANAISDEMQNLKLLRFGNDPVDTYEDMRRVYTPEVMSRLSPETLQQVKEGFAALKPQVAINKWIDTKLAKYMQNEFATPEDPVRALIERGISPARNPGDINPFYYDTTDLFEKRREAGFPAEGLARTEAGRNWEDMADSSVNMSYLKNLLSSLKEGQESKYGISRVEANRTLRDNPWLNKLTLPYTPIYGALGANYRPVFTHVIDELQNAMATNSGLPKNLQLDPDDLSKMNVPQVVELVDKINKWRVENVKNLQLEETLKADLYKAYPEQKYRWVQLNRPGQFAAESDAMGHSVRGYEPRDKGGSDYYGLGGFKAIESGEAKIYSLRDEKGQPHVTIEVSAAPGAMTPSEFYHSDLATQSLFDRLDKVDEATIKKDESSWWEKVVRESPEYQEYIKAIPAKITQIKGKGNEAPAKKYWAFAQDFVKSSNWSDVQDLKNIGLRKTSSVFNEADIAKLKAMGEEVPNYVSGRDILRLQDLVIPEGKRLKYDDAGHIIGYQDERFTRYLGFKKGGPVDVPRETSTSKQQLDKLAQVSQRKKA